MARKYYAVRVGKIPGIYNTWSECEKMVKGYKGAIYKSFLTLDEAKSFLGKETSYLNKNESNSASFSASGDKSIDIENNYSFVDGSFNSCTGVYGYGGFVFSNGKKHILQGSGNDKEMASMRNVAGEILGAMAAIKKSIELGLDCINIYYDYMGIEMWAKGLWKCNKQGTKDYQDFIKENQSKIKINFIKIKGHSGVEGNEEADMLAKKAVGII